MIVLALTGSIGMGKTTTASFFAEAGVPVYNADKAVHALYQDEEVIVQVKKIFPEAVIGGKIDRAILAAQVFGNNEALSNLEAIILPLIHHQEVQFIAKAKAEHKEFVLLDIPLFFEKKRNDLVDKVIVVTAQPETQKARVLARDDMSIEKFEAILKRQIPDEDKRALADFVISTDKGFEDSRQQVQNVLNELRRQETTK